MEEKRKLMDRILADEIREAEETPCLTELGIPGARLEWLSILTPSWDVLELALNEHARASRLLQFSIKGMGDFYKISVLIERDPMGWGALRLFQNLKPVFTMEKGSESCQPICLLSTTFSISNGCTPQWVEKAAQDWEKRYRDFLSHGCVFEPEPNGHRVTVFFLKKLA